MFFKSFEQVWGSNCSVFKRAIPILRTLKLNQIDYSIYLEIEFRAENFTKFCFEFLGFFYVFGYFLWFSDDFWKILEICPDSVDRIGSVDRIRRAEHRFLRPECCLNVLKLFFYPLFAFFVLLWVFLLIPHLLNTSQSSISLSPPSLPPKLLKNPSNIKTPNFPLQTLTKHYHLVDHGTKGRGKT